ncbi:adhesion G-protein coupled receptor F3 isoform X3 [Ochotona princeps]|uniref:adhesion G-protein coupled receptor F3 isoform X3 n=1 Tax=Ochotona princeps TaxID=9978 RepID=UPI002714796E|nr:adhesion G-protein coupled receptor F3 isoform X3 [Ochotona princeps]
MQGEDGCALPWLLEGQSQAGGGSEQPPTQEGSAGAVPSAPVESALVAVHLRLEVPEEAWLSVLAESLTLPTTLPTSSFTRLSLTTVCNASRQDAAISCTCCMGYQWNISFCSSHQRCPDSPRHPPCRCLIFRHSEPSYCQLLPPGEPGRELENRSVQAPWNQSLPSSRHTPGSTLQLTLRFSQEFASLRWLLRSPGEHNSPLGPGAQVSLIPSQDQAALPVTPMPQEWAGEHTSSFKAQGVLWELYQVVNVSLRAAHLLDQLSVFCTSSSGFQLSCCVPNTSLTYMATWSSGEDSEAPFLHTLSPQCLVQAVQHCPATNITSTCELQSQGSASLRVPVSITEIQDGDIMCSEDSWNITKAVFRVLADLIRLQSLEERTMLPSDLLSLLNNTEHLGMVVAQDQGQLKPKILQNILITVDKILDMNISSLWTAVQVQYPRMPSFFLWAMETLASRLHLLNRSFTLNLTNVFLHSQIYPPTSSSNYIIALPLVQAQIPWHSLAPHVPNGTSVRITSLLLQKLDHLLPTNYGQGLGDDLYVTSGHILSISIMAGHQAIRQANVIMHFEAISGVPHCVFWNYNLFWPKGGWSKEGCRVAFAKRTAQCICEHLTAFSILMSKHSAPQDPALDLLSQVGLGASIMALLACLAVYRLVWKCVVRNKIAYFRHAALLNMALCLLAADTCFLGSLLFQPEPQSLFCLTTAFFSHFLYLATFFWMLAQALVLAHHLLFVFHPLSKHRVLTLMVILGYLCPLCLAGATMGLYLPRKKYLRPGLCWLDAKGGAYYTFVGPVLIIVGVNGLVLAMAVLKLLRPSLSEGPPAEKRQALLGVVKALLVLTPVFGLTWVLSLATLLETGSIVPHYIFTIFNAFQGVFILLFGCLMDRKVLEALQKRFCHTQAPRSAISLGTSEIHISDQSKGGRESSSRGKDVTD